MSEDQFRDDGWCFRHPDFALVWCNACIHVERDAASARLAAVERERDVLSKLVIMSNEQTTRAQAEAARLRAALESAQREICTDHCQDSGRSFTRETP